MRSLELFQINIQRSEELIKLHSDMFSKGRPVSKGVSTELLRAVVVFTMAALDAYIHKRVCESVKRIMHFHKRIPDKCVELIRTKFKDKDGYREILSLAIQKDSETKILSLIDEMLSVKTFQKPDQIEFAFKMMELKDPWSKINKIIRPTRGPRRRGRLPKVEKILTSLSERRDQIVHENDMYVSKKYHGKIRSIGRREVVDHLDKIVRIVFAIEKLAEE